MRCVCFPVQAVKRFGESLRSPLTWALRRWPLRIDSKPDAQHVADLRCIAAGVGHRAALKQPRYFQKLGKERHLAQGAVAAVPILDVSFGEDGSAVRKDRNRSEFSFLEFLLP